MNNWQITALVIILIMLFISGMWLANQIDNYKLTEQDKKILTTFDKEKRGEK